MAVAFQSQSVGTVAGSTTLTFSHTPSGTNRVLIVDVVCLNASSVLSVTFNGNAMTQISSQINVAGLYRHAAFYLNNPTASAANVVVTSVSSTDIRACAATYSDAMQTSAVIDGSNTGSNDGIANLSVTITTSFSGTWGCSCVGDEGGPTTPNSQTSRSTSVSSPGAKIADTNASISIGPNTSTLASNGGFTTRSNIYFGIRQAGAAAAPTTGFLMQYLAQQ